MYPLHRKSVSPSLKIIIRRRPNKCCLWIRIWWLLHFLCLWVLFSEALGMADFIRLHSLRRIWKKGTMKIWIHIQKFYELIVSLKKLNDKHCIQKLLYLIRLHNDLFLKDFKITITFSAFCRWFCFGAGWFICLTLGCSCSYWK